MLLETWYSRGGLSVAPDRDRRCAARQRDTGDRFPLHDCGHILASGALVLRSPHGCYPGDRHPTARSTRRGAGKFTCEQHSSKVKALGLPHGAVIAVATLFFLAASAHFKP